MTTVHDAIKSMLEGKSDDEKLHILSHIIPSIHIEGRKLGIKLFDNYGYRQIQMIKPLREIWKNFQMSKKRTGKDGWSEVSPVLDNIEMKSMDSTAKDPLNLSFPFDKQNDPVRRAETLKYNAFVFGVTFDETIRIILTTEHPDTIGHLNTLLEKLQGEFIKKWEENIAAKRRGGHDAVRLSMKDMLIKEHIWNVWIDGVWHKNIKSDGCVTKLKKFYNTLEKPVKGPRTAEQKAASAAKAAATKAANKAKKATSASPPSTS